MTPLPVITYRPPTQRSAVDPCLKVAKEVDGLHELSDFRSERFAEWKARAEKAEAALKAAEDDRHPTTLTTP